MFISLPTVRIPLGNLQWIEARLSLAKNQAL